MSALVLALSISDKIEQFGSYAGYASVLGIGVLALLYFAQAREVRRLREWAGRAPERAAELEAQAVQAAERARAAPPRPAAAAVTPAAAVPGVSPLTVAATTAGAAAAPVAAGASTAAALTAAPAASGSAPGPGAPSATPASVTPAGAPPAPAPPAPPAPPLGAAPTVSPAGGPAPAVPPAAAPVDPALPPPTSILEAAAAGQSTVRPPAPPPRPVTTAGAGVPRPRRTVELGSSGVPSATPVSRTRRGGRPPLRLALIAAVPVILIAVLAVVLLGGGGDDGATTPANRIVTTPVSTGTAPNGGSAPTKAETIVVVLNGTTVAGLAGTIGDQLVAKGYEVDKVTNATDQAQPLSQVAYATGFRAAGATVARLAGVSRVVAMDTSTRVEAGDRAKVVITVGADTAARAR